jgi:hypothetical protein
MIIFSHFIALISDRPINLDQAVVIHCQLVKSIVANVNFSQAVIFGQSRILSHQSLANIILMALSKPRIKQSRANSISSWPHLVGSALLCYKNIVALQLVTYQFSCPMSFLQLNWAVLLNQGHF